MRESARVVLIGGGITGLSAAYYLQAERQARGIAVDYTLLEQSGRWGGKIQTEEVAHESGTPFVIEAGPDAFITQKPWAWALARELGMLDRVLATNDRARRTFVLHKGRPTPLPEGVMLIVPTRFRPFALSPLISPLGKLRMGLELFIPPRRGDEDESVAGFVRRRLGAEALDTLAEPLLSGIYNAEAESQSLLATFPRFREIEATHGSLIRGMAASGRGQRARGAAPADGSKAPSAFVSFKLGMAELVRRLRAELSGDCRLDAPVAALERVAGGYVVILASGERLPADHVILAIPAYEAARLLEPVAPEAAAELRAIRYVSTGTLSLAFRREEIDHPLDGFGIVIPRGERRDINAVTWTSTKFEQRAPGGHALLRVFFGGSRTPHMMALDDGALIAVARRELRSIMGIDAEPLFHRVYRWWDATPQYDVGHLTRVAAMEASLPPGLHATGSPYRGIGVPDCIHQARQTVGTLLDTLASPAAAATEVHDA